MRLPHASPTFKIWYVLVIPVCPCTCLEFCSTDLVDRFINSTIVDFRICHFYVANSILIKLRVVQERIVANLQKISVITGICMLFHFLHYASAASITVVILVILTRNWPWFKFMSTFPAQILIETYKGVRGWLAWTKEYIISAARKSNSNVAEYHLKID